ncbi:MAG: prepilin-type N-terminal cleavage/methylation domain-containing protein [Clostridiales Family XIII bacterium]|jgi:type IV pilus assembly protein PilA|nr:prepilin-type N-terminal cleavage/methylation domain-containing protein [Clostridiales Family XIII bacterium]
MNMILKKRLASEAPGWSSGAGPGGRLSQGVPRSGGVVIGRRKGFTLVEVIVVLVILAILAAIAIPALTGYIDKAEDKKWIAQARNAMAAFRTVVDESYSDGTLGQWNPTTGDFKDYTTAGDYRFAASPKIKFWYGNRVSEYSTADSNRYTFDNRAAELAGIEPTDPLSADKQPNNNIYWEMFIYAPKSSEYTAANAPAWAYLYYPEGQHPKKPVVFVTYGLSGLGSGYVTSGDVHNTITSSAGVVFCDPDAGYRVFHVVTPNM